MEKKISRLTTQAMLMAIMVIMGFTPLGSIPLPVMKATTTHIPVIIAAILFGPKAGAAFGIGFGFVSMIRQTLMPNITSFAFTPFLPIPGVDGFNWQGIVIAFLPRILIGLSVAYLYKFFESKKFNQHLSLVVCGIIGSMVNTILVLGLIYVLVGGAYAAAQGITTNALLLALLTTVVSNGIGEAVLAAVLVAAVITALKKVFPKM